MCRGRGARQRATTRGPLKGAPRGRSRPPDGDGDVPRSVRRGPSGRARVEGPGGGGGRSEQVPPPKGPIPKAIGAALGRPHRPLGTRYGTKAQRHKAEVQRKSQREKLFSDMSWAPFAAVGKQVQSMRSESTAYQSYEIIYGRMTYHRVQRTPRPEGWAWAWGWAPGRRAPCGHICSTPNIRATEGRGPLAPRRSAGLWCVGTGGAQHESTQTSAARRWACQTRGPVRVTKSETRRCPWAVL